MSHTFKIFSRIASAAAAAVCLVSLPAGAEAPRAKPPVAAFGNLPMFSRLSLSPDGQHMAMMRETDGKNAILIIPTHPKPGDKPYAITGGNQFLSGLVWLNNDHLAMITKANAEAGGDDRIRTWLRAISTNLDGSQQVMLLNNLKSFNLLANNAYILDIAPSDPQHIYMGAYTVSPVTGNHFDIYKVDIVTGKGEITASGLGNPPSQGASKTVGNGETTDWLTDGNGNPVARTDSFSHPLQDRVSIKKNGLWEVFDTFDVTADKDTGLLGLTMDGSALVIRKDNAQRADALFTHNLKTGEVKALYDAGKYDARPLGDRWTGRVIGAGYVEDDSKVVYFDNSLEGLHKGLQKAFPDVSVHLVSWDVEHKNFIFAIDGPKQPTVYYTFDHETKQAKPIAYTYPELKPEDLGEMKPYYYKARDGLEIPAYITLPPGKVAKNLPAIVMPHGGPDARDSIGFDWWAQFLANRGYVVLQPNFRGSAGYGKTFTEKGLKRWGLEMQDDITDGVKKMIADGIADPKRICIVGASYGGYATLAGVTFTPDLYACGASWAGVSDLPMIMKTETEQAGGDSKLVSFWMSRMGTDSEQLRATSPALHAEKVKCPVLLMHGEGDTTVRIDQSEAEYDALKAVGKDVEFIRFAGGEDHYLNTAETRIKMLTALEKFLDAHIGH